MNTEKMTKEQRLTAEMAIRQIDAGICLLLNLSYELTLEQEDELWEKYPFHDSLDSLMWDVGAWLESMK